MSKQTEMTPREAILAVLGAVPDQRIEGKKRLQKLIQLLQFSGAPIQASYSIHHYGPYSSSIADAAEELCLFEEIKCEEKPCGNNGMWQSVYSLEPANKKTSFFSDRHQEILKKLNGYSTVELEVASTVALFLREGLSKEEAVKETEDLKPTRAIPQVLKKADEILGLCSAA